MKTMWIVCCSIAAVLAAAYLCLNQGVAVTVKNVGSSPLRSVVIQATGFSHSLGQLNVGQSSHASVFARGESHIELEHADGPRLIVSCYFENGYRGTILVEIATDKVVRKDCNVRPGIL